MADCSLQGAEGVHAAYTKDRAVGAKKVGRRAQNFIKAFADFLGAYSGIVELVKGAGQQYGQIAYETLSMLLTVCLGMPVSQFVLADKCQVVVNKCNNDTRIADFLSELRMSFPELGTLMEVYSPSSTIKERIVSVYTEVIIFARMATEYFGRPLG